MKTNAGRLAMLPVLWLVGSTMVACDGGGASDEHADSVDADARAPWLGNENNSAPNIVIDRQRLSVVHTPTGFDVFREEGDDLIPLGSLTSEDILSVPAGEARDIGSFDAALSSDADSTQLRSLSARALVEAMDLEFADDYRGAEHLVLRSALMARSGNQRAMRFRASRGPGARIRYVHIGLQDRDDPASTSGVTDDARASLVWGHYYIWAERGGEPTSDQGVYFTINDSTESPIVLEESP